MVCAGGSGIGARAGVGMITLGSAPRYFLYREPADMRMSFDGLCGLVRNRMKLDPKSGDVFVFLNRRRSHVRLRVWENAGYAQYYKRLEHGMFERPDQSELQASEVMLLLRQIELTSIRYRRRNRRRLSQ